MANIAKPIQIRLPDDVETALRFTAYKSKNTLNAITIEALRAYLKNGKPFGAPDIPRLHISTVEGLDEYQSLIQTQLHSVLRLASLLNTQSMVLTKLRNKIETNDPALSDDLDPVKPAMSGNEGMLTREKMITELCKNLFHLQIQK